MTVESAIAQSKLTPELIDKIAESLRVNPSWRAAADYAGVTDRTVRNWRNRGEQFQSRIDAATDISAIQDDRDYPHWVAYQRWLEARSRGEIELIAVIRRAATDGDWRAAQALARMGWPDRYIERVEVTGAEGEPLIPVEERIEALVEKAKAARCAKRKTKKPAMPEPEETHA